MENKLSPSDLVVFLAVLDEGGFRAAAKRLASAPSKVSTTVSRIERDLGVPLFLRTTRSVRATEEGLALANRIRPLLKGIEEACRQTADLAARVQGRLKLNVPGAVMPDILPPLIVEFQNAYPDVEVDIVMENDLVDLVASGCDAGIRYGNVLEKDMVSIPIGPRIQHIALAASQQYLQQRGKPKVPTDLQEHDAIRYRLGGGRLLPWAREEWKKGVRRTENPPNGQRGYVRYRTSICPSGARDHRNLQQLVGSRLHSWNARSNSVRLVGRNGGPPAVLSKSLRPAPAACVRGSVQAQRKHAKQCRWQS